MIIKVPSFYCQNQESPALWKSKDRLFRQFGLTLSEVALILAGDQGLLILAAFFGFKYVDITG